VVEDEAGRILIARRPAHLHEGGKWEFPGGKLEADEAVERALARELAEELDIEVQAARPFIRIHHAYPQHRVLLDVWRVQAWRGRARGREQQETRWVAPEDLDAHEFPAANVAIITAVRLPSLYLVTPEPDPRDEQFFMRLETGLRGGARLVQLRAKAAAPDALRRLARHVRALCDRYGARVLVNGDPASALECGAHGVHLSSARLAAARGRPLPKGFLVGVSCHDRCELERAVRIDADFAVLGPVSTTRSHPSAPALGWAGFAELTEIAALPVYALGGLTAADMRRAWAAGAQGVACIGAFWRAADPDAAISAFIDAERAQSR
jgi:8-oxo-dGTP diphosphatase